VRMQLERLFAEYVTESQAQYVETADIKAVLDSLKQRNIWIGLATADTVPSAKNCLKRLEVLEKFDYVGADDGVLRPKPEADMFLEFQKKFGLKPQEIAVVYNGIERIPIPSAEEKAALLSSFGGKAGEKAVGMVARLEEVKDHETFLLGAKKLLDKRQDVRFYIVGDGSLRKQLEQKAAALGIREHVTFTGFLQDVEKIEAALDIAVITSRAEALCLSILESMIAGIPAVGTDSGGVAEVIRHGENGFLIPVGDSDALAERLDELLADDAKRSAFGAQAKKDAEATFLAEQMTRKIEKLYLEAGK